MRTENADLLEKICDGLYDDGYAIIDDAFPSTIMASSLEYLSDVSIDDFKTAGIGRADDYQTNREIRRDKILWLDETEAENLRYLKWIEELRMVLNRRLFLGLYDYECMFAHYPIGAYYQKHVDTFKSEVLMAGSRKISTVLYLNADWQVEDGGELALYLPDQDQPFKKILPEMGRLVLFLSEDFPHEVLPAKRSRYSLTGWFRTQP